VSKRCDSLERSDQSIDLVNPLTSHSVSWSFLLYNLYALFAFFLSSYYSFHKKLKIKKILFVVQSEKKELRNGKRESIEHLQGFYFNHGQTSFFSPLSVSLFRCRFCSVLAMKWIFNFIHEMSIYCVKREIFLYFS
jgi:hypothetical protein